MKLVGHDCIECLEPGEGMRSPRPAAMPLVAYFLRCPKCGWKNMARKAKEEGGKATINAGCVRCGSDISVRGVEIPGAAS